MPLQGVCTPHGSCTLYSELCTLSVVLCTLLFSCKITFRFLSVQTDGVYEFIEEIYMDWWLDSYSEYLCGEKGILRLHRDVVDVSFYL